MGFIPEGFDFFIKAVAGAGAGGKDHRISLYQLLRSIAAGYIRTGAFDNLPRQAARQPTEQTAMQTPDAVREIPLPWRSPAAKTVDRPAPAKRPELLLALDIWFNHPQDRMVSLF